MGAENLTVDLRQWYMSMCEKLHFSFDTAALYFSTSLFGRG